MATVRQSVFSLGYIFILIFRMKDGAEVLKQRNFQEKKEINDLEDKMDELQEQLDQENVKKVILEELDKKIKGRQLVDKDARERKVQKVLKMST